MTIDASSSINADGITWGGLGIGTSVTAQSNGAVDGAGGAGHGGNGGGGGALARIHI